MKLQSWPELPGIDIRQRPLRCHTAERVIHFHGKEKLTLLLLPDGMFSVLSHAMTEGHIDDVLIALAQVIVDHVAGCAGSTGEEHVRQELTHLYATATITGPMTWSDLPGADLTYFSAPADTIYCGVRAGTEVAIFVSVRDPALIFSWARFSTRRFDRAFALAFGRVVISNTQVVRSGVRGR